MVNIKTYCKNINIEDSKAIKPFIFDYLTNKGSKGINWKRKNFLKLIEQYTSYKKESLFSFDNDKLYEAMENISLKLSVEISKRIKNRELNLEPIHFFNHIDGISLKEREISNVSPMQRIMDYIAISALEPLFKAKIMPHQYASLKGKGQVAGKRTIERWIRKNKDVRYFVKLDIEKCFNSISKDLIMRFLKRDIHKNGTLIWFVEALLSTYTRIVNNTIECNLIIGTLLSQWLCNYILSYLYRYVDGLYKIKKSKREGNQRRVRLLSHLLFYMDDILITSTRRTDLKKVVKNTLLWAKNNLNLTIHDNWQIRDASRFSIDMMGYVICFKNTIVRSRIFLRARRQFIRAFIDIQNNKTLSKIRAQKIISYSGYFKHSNSKYFKIKYHFELIITKAKETISNWAKARNRLAEITLAH